MVEAFSEKNAMIKLLGKPSRLPEPELTHEFF
jgi:hypothetical protein